MTTTHWLSDEEQAAWRALRRMQLLLNAQISRDLASIGLSDADYDVLSDLSEAEGHRYRISDLAGRLLWSSSRISHHLGRMEQRGLVTRTDSPEDGRGAYVVLTKAGLKAIRTAAPDHVASVRTHFLDVLGKDDLRVLTKISAAVLAGLEPQ